MTLLVVDDNRSVLAAVKLLAEIKFDRVITTTSPSRIPSLLREETPDCVLLDMNFTSPVTNGNEGLYWLSEIRRISPTTPVVLFTAYAEIELAVQGLKEGAVDFISKPWNNARLLQTLLNAVSHPRHSTPNTNSHPHQSTPNTISPHQSASSTLSNIPSTKAASPHSTPNPVPSPQTPHSPPTTLEQMERRMIAEALADNGGNLSATATQLGITRQTLYNKLRRHHLDP